MEICEGKRVRKAVNYAEVLCESQDDDDFADFSPPPKKIQEEKLKQANEDREKRVNGHYSDKEKDNRDNKENKHDRDKYREQDKEKSDKDRSRDKNDKAKDRDKHRREDKYEDKNGKDKDCERKDDDRSKLDREKENKERTHSEVKKQNSDREEEDKSGLYNKANGDGEKRVNCHYSDKEKKDKRDDKEKKHNKEKYKEQYREKSDKDRSRDKNDKAKDRDKHRREDKYGDKNRKDKDSERKDESRSKLDRKGENKERTHSEVKKRDSDRGREDKSGLYNKSSLSPISASHTLTSIQKSPNKTTKPRLTIEEKLFQRELEAAIAISRLAAGDVADFKTQPDQRKTRVDKEVTYRTDAPTCTTLPGSESSPRPIHSTSQLSSSLQNQEANERNKVCSFSPHNESTNAKADTAGEITSMDLLELKRLESNAGSKNENSQPSTSTGITSKRQRKTVVFKEDTDSDSFDGFSIDADPDSDFSEGSDFALSPKKKKKKKNKEKKQLKNSKSKSPKPIQIPTPIVTVTSSAIENNDLKNLSSLSVPPSPTITSLRSPYNVTPCSPLIVSKGKPTSSSTIVKEKSKAVLDLNSANTKSSPANSRINLVKTPFRSPLLQSPGNSSSDLTTRSSLIINKNTGLRLGLSRRTSVKPLHPSVSLK